MDIWEKMYEEAQKLYDPHEVSDFVYANHYGGSSGMPCGACREFLLELNAENKAAEFMMDYDTRKTVKVAELIPYWWGEERASKFKEQ